MIEQLSKISELEKFVNEKQKEIEPIRREISKSFHEVERIKKELVEKYVQKTHEFILDKVITLNHFPVKRFTIVAVDFNGETEVVLETEDGGQSGDYLGHSDIFKLFIHTPDYQRILRKENLKSILDE